jgi:hypothetical protein
VLEDVAREGDVDAAVGDRKVEARRADRASRDTATGGELAGIRLDAGISRPRAREGIGEVPRASTDVKDRLAIESRPTTEQRHRIRSEGSVESVRVGLLDPKSTEQSNRPPEGRPFPDRPNTGEVLG